jgi:hypothetical protein
MNAKFAMMATTYLLMPTINLDAKFVLTDVKNVMNQVSK